MQKTTGKPDHLSIVQYSLWEPEVDFLYIIGTKVWRVFLLAIPSQSPLLRDFTSTKLYVHEVSFGTLWIKGFGWYQIAVSVDSILFVVWTLLKCSITVHIHSSHINTNTIKYSSFVIVFIFWRKNFFPTRITAWLFSVNWRPRNMQKPFLPGIMDSFGTRYTVKGLATWPQPGYHFPNSPWGNVANLFYGVGFRIGFDNLYFR